MQQHRNAKLPLEYGPEYLSLSLSLTTTDQILTIYYSVHLWCWFSMLLGTISPDDWIIALKEHRTRRRRKSMAAYGMKGSSKQGEASWAHLSYP